MVAKMNQSLDIERYKKFAIDLNTKNAQHGADSNKGVFDLRRSMRL